MKNKKSKINIEIFEKAKEKLLNIFPQVSKKSFYVSNFKDSKVFPNKETNTYEAVVGDVTRNPLILRAYRKNKDKKKSSILYKVDELNTHTKRWRQTHKKIKDHGIKHSVFDDMMKQSEMTVDFISDDGGGNLKPNIQPNGMVNVYVNFPDPMEEIKQNIIKKMNK